MRQVDWNGHFLTIEMVVKGQTIVCRVPRNTIDCLPRYRDFIDREIGIHKIEIALRLQKAIFGKIDSARSPLFELLAEDLEHESRSRNSAQDDK